MGKITIFRVTEEDDTEEVDDKIEFNVSDVTQTEGAYITGLEFDPIDGVGNNQGAEQELGDQQALGLVEETIKISGFISKRDGDKNDGQNAFLTLLNTWKNEPKINDAWEYGRFGFIDEDDHTKDLIPVNTGDKRKALLWQRLKQTTDMSGNRILFEFYLRVNFGDGT